MNKAVTWRERFRPLDEDLRRFRAEDSALFGVQEDGKDNGADAPKWNAAR